MWLQSPLWMVTEDSASGCHGNLCVSGSRVVWYEGLHPYNRTVRKVYSVESEILQAFWCQFSKESVSPSGGESRRGDQSLRCVCVREHSCLTFFMQTGAVHYIPLPFLVSGWVALQVDIHPSLHPICVSVIHPFFPPPVSLFIHQTIPLLKMSWSLLSSSSLQVHQAWPISGGVLLERKVSPDGGSDGLPTLFTLLHPMDDFCPATFRRPTASEAQP